jgi:hypothetical protein
MGKKQSPPLDTVAPVRYYLVMKTTTKTPGRDDETESEEDEVTVDLELERAERELEAESRDRNYRVDSLLDSRYFTGRLHELETRLGCSTDREGYETVRRAIAGDETARRACAERLVAEDTEE